MKRPATVEQIRQAPKALLHDHLDGGVRPATIVELASEVGYHGLPTTDVGDLAKWFVDAASSGSLERYLETFEHTDVYEEPIDQIPGAKIVTETHYTYLRGTSPDRQVWPGPAWHGIVSMEPKPFDRYRDDSDVVSQPTMLVAWAPKKAANDGVMTFSALPSGLHSLPSQQPKPNPLPAGELLEERAVALPPQSIDRLLGVEVLGPWVNTREVEHRLLGRGHQGRAEISCHRDGVELGDRAHHEPNLTVAIGQSKRPALCGDGDVADADRAR